MFRRSISPRLLRITFVAAVCAALGLGVAGLWSIASAETPAPRVLTAATAGTSSAPSAALDGPGTSTSSPSTGSPAPNQAPAAGLLTADEATAIATQAYPGRVVEFDQDYEPTGLLYDVTILHDDGITVTEVEVDAATGQIVSVKQDNWDGD
jgi:hypothetical protein